MIVGLKKWNDPVTAYIQTNNPTEEILRKLNAPTKLESCGPTAATMLCAAIGADTSIVTPGGYMPQPEEILFDYFNDPRNALTLLRIRRDVDPGKYMGNEVPQFYTAAVPAVFGVPAYFRERISIDVIQEALEVNHGVMVTLRSPGHYIAIVALDIDTGEVIYNDPWPGNPWPVEMAGKPTFNRRVPYAALMANVKPYRVVIG